MYATINNKYGEAESYSQPIVSHPIPRDTFMEYVREAVDKMYARSNVTRNNFRMRANVLEHYLNKYGINEINPDEQFIKEMWDRLKESCDFEGRSYQWETCKKVPRFTREVINDFLYAKGVVKRQVLKEIVIQRYEKFFGLTQNSREAIKWFEENGKRVEAVPVYFEKDGDISNQLIRMMHRVTKRELKPVTKNGKIEHAIRFLKAVNKNGFEFITDDDVKKYEEICLQRGVKQKEDYLAHIATFFINIYSKGFIKSNPLSHVSLKMNGGAIKKDFITQDGMDKLRDLSTLDKSNKEEVRDRLFILLAYDLALRVSEILALEVDDFRKDEQGEWFVTIKPENQKGWKDEETMYFWFDETKQLLDLYLRTTRKKFKPAADYLIISSQKGKGLSAAHCSTRVRLLCEKFGIKTYYGAIPSPHTLRHTFATLNIEPIGLSLSLYDMAQRLRHTKVETTRRHYIHNNPYLKKIKHAVQRKSHRIKTSKDVLNEMSLPELEHWLSDTLELDSNTIRQVRINHKKKFDPLETQIDKKQTDTKISISESEALEMVKDLQVPALALRKYAQKKGCLTGDFEGNSRYGKGFRYQKELIEDLARNWVSADLLRTKRNWSERTFYRILRKEKWRTIKLGKSLYVNRMDYV